MINVNLPPMESCLLLQLDNLALMLSIIGCHVPIRLGLAPTGMPRNLKGIEPMLHAKNWDIPSITLSSILIPTTLLFAKLTFKPEASSSSQDSLQAPHNLVSLPSQKNMVSSANWRRGMDKLSSTP